MRKRYESQLRWERWVLSFATRCGTGQIPGLSEKGILRNTSAPSSSSGHIRPYSLSLFAPTAHLIKRLQSGLSAFGKTVRNLVLRRSFAGFFYPQGQHEALALDGCSVGGCLDAPFRVSYFCLDARVKAANSSFFARVGSFALSTDWAGKLP